MIPNDPRHIPQQMASCFVYKAGGKRENCRSLVLVEMVEDLPMRNDELILIPCFTLLASVSFALPVKLFISGVFSLLPS